MALSEIKAAFVMFSSEKTKAFYGRNNGGNGGNVDSGTSKSSYYVWFLGSREAKGLRGAEYVRPAVRHLLEYKTDLCRKMTLQVRVVRGSFGRDQGVSISELR